MPKSSVATIPPSAMKRTADPVDDLPITTIKGGKNQQAHVISPTKKLRPRGISLLMGRTKRKRVRFDPAREVYKIDSSTEGLWWMPDELHRMKTQFEDDIDREILIPYLRDGIDIYKNVLAGDEISTERLELLQDGLDSGYRGMERWCTDMGQHRKNRTEKIVHTILAAEMHYKEEKRENKEEDLRRLSRKLSRGNRAYAAVMARADAMAVHGSSVDGDDATASTISSEDHVE